MTANLTTKNNSMPQLLLSFWIWLLWYSKLVHCQKGPIWWNIFHSSPLFEPTWCNSNIESYSAGGTCVKICRMTCPSKPTFPGETSFSSIPRRKQCFANIDVLVPEVLYFGTLKNVQLGPILHQAILWSASGMFSHWKMINIVKTFIWKLLMPIMKTMQFQSLLFSCDWFLARKFESLGFIHWKLWPCRI